MRMHPPKNESSHIQSIGFDEETETLAVRFHRGGTYYYHGVDEETYQKLQKAESPGEFFCTNIKGKIPHRKTG